MQNAGWMFYREEEAKKGPARMKKNMPQVLYDCCGHPAARGGLKRVGPERKYNVTRTALSRIKSDQMTRSPSPNGQRYNNNASQPNHTPTLFQGRSQSQLSNFGKVNVDHYWYEKGSGDTNSAIEMMRDIRANNQANELLALHRHLFGSPGANTPVSHHFNGNDSEVLVDGHNNSRWGTRAVPPSVAELISPLSTFVSRESSRRKPRASVTENIPTSPFPSLPRSSSLMNLPPTPASTLTSDVSRCVTENAHQHLMLRSGTTRNTSPSPSQLLTGVTTNRSDTAVKQPAYLQHRQTEQRHRIDDIILSGVVRQISPLPAVEIVTKQENKC